MIELKKTFNGEKPLLITYWIWFFIPTIIFCTLLHLFYYHHYRIVIFIAYAGYLLLIIKGVWKSAEAHQGSETWKFLAKTTAVFNLTAVFYLMIQSALLSKAMP